MTNKRATETEFVVGIDCALEKHHYQISKKDGAVLSKGPLKNTKKDGKRLVKKLESITQKKNIVIGMEPTNNYHICMQKYLISNGYKVVLINPLKTHAYKQIDDYGNKTDPIDANGICQFLIDGKHKNIKQMNQKYLKMRELCRCRQKLKCDMTRVALRLHSRLVVINPEFTQYFYKNFCESALFVLENYPTPDDLEIADVDKLQKELDRIARSFAKKGSAEKIINLAKESFGVKEDIEGYIRYMQYHLEEYRFLKSKVLEINREIKSEAKKDYCRREIEIISSIRGIGIILAAGILSELGDIKNFEKISSIVRFAGMIVLRNQSGKFDGRTRMSKQGNKYLRYYLHQAAMGAKMHCPTFAAIYMNRSMKVKDLDPESRRVDRAKTRGCLARRILETIAMCLMKDRMFDDKIAFESIQIDDFVRETINTQFKGQMATAAA